MKSLKLMKGQLVTTQMVIICKHASVQEKNKNKEKQSSKKLNNNRFNATAWKDGTSRYTNADLKISLYVLVNIRTIP